MVQVDVFWSYGLGATFAAASSRQLLARRRAATAAEAAPVAEPQVGPPAHSRWRDPYLLRTLLFLALIFGPSGVYLVWAFPSWETMHVGTKDMPAWLVTLFAVTNITQTPEARVIRDETDQHKQIELFAAWITGISTNLRPIFEILRTAAAVEPLYRCPASSPRSISSPSSVNSAN